MEDVAELCAYLLSGAGEEAASLMGRIESREEAEAGRWIGES